MVCEGKFDACPAAMLSVEFGRGSCKGYARAASIFVASKDQIDALLRAFHRASEGSHLASVRGCLDYARAGLAEAGESREPHLRVRVVVALLGAFRQS